MAPCRSPCIPEKHHEFYERLEDVDLGEDEVTVENLCGGEEEGIYESEDDESSSGDSDGGSLIRQSDTEI